MKVSLEEWEAWRRDAGAYQRALAEAIAEESQWEDEEQE